MRWPVPPITAAAELAAFLDLHLGELAWLADARGWEAPSRPSSFGTIALSGRLVREGSRASLEQPKSLLKELQRRILHEILDEIQAHPDAHGFRRGHSALTHARRHTGQRVVIGFDLEDFFASVSPARVFGIFRGAGYPDQVGGSQLDCSLHECRRPPRVRLAAATG
jgi:RNA-directed DNA polymerase